MGKYTISVGEILVAGNAAELGISLFTNDVPQLNFHDEAKIVHLAQTYMFGSALAQIDAEFRDAFTLGFVRHFRRREIGCDNVDLFIDWLDDDLITNAHPINNIYRALKRDYVTEYTKTTGTTQGSDTRNEAGTETATTGQNTDSTNTVTDSGSGTVTDSGSNTHDLSFPLDANGKARKTTTQDETLNKFSNNADTSAANVMATGGDVKLTTATFNTDTSSVTQEGEEHTHDVNGNSQVSERDFVNTTVLAQTVGGNNYNERTGNTTTDTTGNTTVETFRVELATLLAGASMLETVWHYFDDNFMLVY